MKSFPLLVSFLLLLFYSSPAAGTSYYVAMTGSDSNTGSPASPFRTIVHAVQTAGTGDTVRVTAGIYDEATTIIINKPLTLIGTANAIVDGSSLSGAIKLMLELISPSNVSIDSLVFRNCIGYGAQGIRMTGGGNNITIQHCVLSNIGWTGNDLIAVPANSSFNAHPLYIAGSSATALSNIRLLSNEIYNCATGYSEAMTLKGNVDHFLIAGNHVHHIANIGIDIAGNYADAGAPPAVSQARNGSVLNNKVDHCMSAIGNAAGIYIDGGLNCIVAGNELTANAVGISIGAEQPTGAGAQPCYGNVIRNNRIYNNAVTGMFIGAGLNSGTVQHTNIYNNTFFRNRTGEMVNGVSSIGGAGPAVYANAFGGEVQIQNCDSTYFVNNILYATRGKRVMVALAQYTATHFQSDYNDYYHEDQTSLIDLTGVRFNTLTNTQGCPNLSAFTQATGLDIHSLSIFPGFRDTALADLRLYPGTPAIDKGDPTADTSLCGALDGYGNPRIYNNRVDMGVFESQVPVAVSAISPIQASTVRIYPNPLADGMLYYSAAEEIISVTIIDRTGRVVQTIAYPQGNVPIDIVPGVYWLQFRDRQGNVSVRKFVRK